MKKVRGPSTIYQCKKKNFISQWPTIHGQAYIQDFQQWMDPWFIRSRRSLASLIQECTKLSMVGHSYAIDYYHTVAYERSKQKPKAEIWPTWNLKYNYLVDSCH